MSNIQIGQDASYNRTSSGFTHSMLSEDERRAGPRQSAIDQDSSEIEPLLVTTINGNLPTLSVWEQVKSIANKLTNIVVLIVMTILPAVISNYTIIYILQTSCAALQLFYTWVQHFRGVIKIFPKTLDVGLLVLNLGLLIYQEVFQPTDAWSKLWCGVVIFGGLFLVTLTTVVVRRPFVRQIAMDLIAEDRWTHPLFLQITHVVSLAWIVVSPNHHP
jgi:hypothetical protein